MNIRLVDKIFIFISKNRTQIDKDLNLTKTHPRQTYNPHIERDLTRTIFNLHSVGASSMDEVTVFVIEDEILGWFFGTFGDFEA